MADGGAVGQDQKKNFKFDLEKEIIVLQKVIACYLWKRGESDFKTIVEELKADDDFKELKEKGLKTRIDNLTDAFANQTLSDIKSDGRKDEYEVRNKLVEIVCYLKGQRVGQPISADKQTLKDMIEEILITVQKQEARKDRELKLRENESENLKKLINIAEDLITPKKKVNKPMKEERK